MIGQWIFSYFAIAVASVAQFIYGRKRMGNHDMFMIGCIYGLALVLTTLLAFDVPSPTPAIIKLCKPAITWIFRLLGKQET